MPRCPSCRRGGFKDHTTVAKHMSQPRSGCNSWLDDLVRIQEHLTQPGNSDLDDTQEPWEDEACAIHPHPDAGEVFDMDVDVGAVGPGVSDAEYFPHATHVYDGGLTFMDQFDTDPFSAQRKMNLYYPFASRQDWELGSWLLRSGLSLVAIDKFLSLELVRQPRSLFAQFSVSFRLKVFPFRLKLRRSSVDELNCCHRVRAGNRW